VNGRHAGIESYPQERGFWDIQYRELGFHGLVSGFIPLPRLVRTVLEYSTVETDQMGEWGTRVHAMSKPASTGCTAELPAALGVASCRARNELHHRFFFGRSLLLIGRLHRSDLAVSRIPRYFASRCRCKRRQKESAMSGFKSHCDCLLSPAATGRKGPSSIGTGYSKSLPSITCEKELTNQGSVLQRCL
jgi:hypothetical protein